MSLNNACNINQTIHACACMKINSILYLRLFTCVIATFNKMMKKKINKKRTCHQSFLFLLLCIFNSEDY